MIRPITIAPNQPLGKQVVLRSLTAFVPTSYSKLIPPIFN